jgi:hypothetical protein
MLDRSDLAAAYDIAREARVQHRRRLDPFRPAGTGAMPSGVDVQRVLLQGGIRATLPEVWEACRLDGRALSDNEGAR